MVLCSLPGDGWRETVFSQTHMCLPLHAAPIESRAGIMYTRGVWGEIEVVQRLVSRQTQKSTARHTSRATYRTLAPEQPFDTVFLLDLMRAKRTDALHPFCSAVDNFMRTCLRGMGRWCGEEGRKLCAIWRQCGTLDLDSTSQSGIKNALKQERTRRQECGKTGFDRAGRGGFAPLMHVCAFCAVGYLGGTEVDRLQWSCER